LYPRARTQASANRKGNVFASPEIPAASRRFARPHRFCLCGFCSTVFALAQLHAHARGQPNSAWFLFSMVGEKNQVKDKSILSFVKKKTNQSYFRSNSLLLVDVGSKPCGGI
jgi:hypothetical protein